MKTRRVLWTRTAVIAMAAFLAVNIGFSKTPIKRIVTMEQKIEMASKNYAVGLESENTGLVESIIKLVAKMKLQVPGADAEGLQEQLDELSVSHPSATVRYKAYIASTICADPEWFTQDENVINADENQFFINAAHRLQEKLFSANTQ